MSKIEVVRGDLTLENTDAIVNAANETLFGGGGVDGAIHRAGGPSILAECKELRRTSYPNGLPTGEAVASTAGDMPMKFVIHTVGPRAWEYPDGGATLLAACHRNSLDVANDLGLHSVSFPAISCGVYGWSVHDAAPIAITTVRDWFSAHPESSVEVVRFVLFSEEARASFESVSEIANM